MIGTAPALTREQVEHLLGLYMATRDTGRAATRALYSGQDTAAAPTRPALRLVREVG